MGRRGKKIEALEPVAVLASPGDTEQICAILEESGVYCVPVGREGLAEAVRSHELCATIADEALFDEELIAALEAAVAEQPAWSNFPFILLMDRASASRHARIMQALGNVGVVERPIDAAILVPNVHAALRSRRRQREAEAYLLQRQEAECRLQQLTETLEARVRARTDDLASANQRLLREIEDRRRAEEELRESEELYRFTVELSQQLVWTASPEGRILSLSARFSELTGIDRKMDPHEGWLASLHPDDEEAILALWEEVLRTEQPSSGEFRMRLADGSYRTFIARAAPRKDKKGRVIRWYGSTEDIEDQKQAQAARNAAEERYRLAARATNDAIWDWDLATDEIHWSESSSETLGYPGRKLGTTSLAWWEERVHPEDREHTVGSLERAAKRGANRWSATYRFRQKNGDYSTFFDRGFIVRDEKGDVTRFVGAMTDLSERQRAEEEIRRMQAELIHVSRLSAMGTMGSTLAHELNQPLTAVTNYVRGSRRLLSDGDRNRIQEVGDALEAAETAALRAGQIVRRLRELVARGTAAIRREELPKLIDEAGVIAFVDAHFLGVTPHVDLDPAAHWVEADRIQIQQVLINLVRNAMQAVKDCKVKEVTVCTQRTSPGQIEVSVADTGGGIPPSVREGLFSPFQGTKPEGLGIGLSISRTIVEAHGGKIWAEDREGGGSVFRFTLPAVPDKAGA